MNRFNSINQPIFLLVVALLFLPTYSFALIDEIGIISFRKSIKSILSNPCLRKNNYGIKIFSLDRGETLYEVRSDKLFIPASNAKIITTAVALKYLGANYRFATKVFTDGILENGVLKGNLYIKGSGDPKLVTEQLWLLVNELRNLPIKKIEGNIIGDDSFFDKKKRVKTWIKNPGAQAYEAPLGALSFNFNTVKIYVSPGIKAGVSPAIVIEPDNVLKSYLKFSGIKFGGKLLEGTIPDNAEELHTHEGEPLALILRGLNKFSNNFVAEQILKTIGAEHFGLPGSTKNGLRVFEEYMKQLGYQSGQYKIFDGSGLSRQNQLSPTILVDIMQDINNDLSIYPEFVTALGVMGVDGNVKNRLRRVESSGKARVKTGTLNFVSSLSGFFESKEGELFAFSILMNDLKCSNGRAKKIQDQIIQKGLKFRRIPTSNVVIDDRVKRPQPSTPIP